MKNAKIHVILLQIQARSENIFFMNQKLDLTK